MQRNDLTSCQLFQSNQSFMKSLRVVFLLSITIITITWASCKKDKTGNGDTKEKKVVVTTIAGDGMDGYINGTALSARFDTPVDVAVGADGSLYVADANNNRIRKITFQ